MAASAPDKYKKFREVLDDLKSAIDGLKRQNIAIGALDDAYAQLAKRSAQIESVEQHFEAASDVLLAPITRRLTEGSRVSWWGLLSGLVLGAIGIGASAVTLLREDPNLVELRTTASEQAKTLRSHEESIESIQRQLADLLSIARAEKVAPSSLVPATADETVLHPYQTQAILSGESNTVALRLMSVRPVQPDVAKDQLAAWVEVWENGKKIGQGQIDRRVHLVTAIASVPGSDGTFVVFENDTIVLDEIHRFAVTRVWSEEPFYRAGGNEFTGVFVKPATQGR